MVVGVDGVSFILKKFLVHIFENFILNPDHDNR